MPKKCNINACFLGFINLYCQKVLIIVVSYNSMDAQSPELKDYLLISLLECREDQQSIVHVEVAGHLQQGRKDWMNERRRNTGE